MVWRALAEAVSTQALVNPCDVLVGLDQRYCQRNTRSAG